MPDPHEMFSFDDLASGLTDDQKHRYTQYRAALYQRPPFARTSNPEELRRRGDETRKLQSMFVQPGTDEDALFDLLTESETDTEVENPHPLGAKYGNAYASPEAATARMTPAAPTQTPVKQAYSGNGRDMGFLERTYGTKDPTRIQQMAAKYAAQRKK